MPPYDAGEQRDQGGGSGAWPDQSDPTDPLGNTGHPAAADHEAADHEPEDEHAQRETGSERDGDQEPASPADPAAAMSSVDPDVAAATTDPTLAPVEGAHFRHIDVVEIRPNPKQPRQVFDEDALAELAYSIREFGVLQPIVVREVDDGYELVMGERRLRAAASAGLATVPAIVRTTSDDAMLRDALLENIHRAQLNPLEEAAAYQQLLDEFGATHDELAARIGRSRPQVSNTIRLLNLPVPVQRRVAAGVLSAGHARALLGVDDSEVQDDLAGRIVAEGLSVRATEELVALHASGHVEKRTARRPSSQRITAPALVELADRLSDAFDTRVKVDLGRSKGRITIEFATIDDLERIVGVMSGQLAMSGDTAIGGFGPATDIDGTAAAEPTGSDVPAAEALAAEPSTAESDAADPNVPEPTAPAAGEGSAAESGGSTDDHGAPSDYSGWGDDHVPDLGAYERIRYDPNDS